MTNVVPSNNLKWSNDTEYRTTTRNTWIKLSTITPAYNVVGNIRVYYEYDPGQCYECFDPPAEWSSFQLRKNGVGIGTSRTGTDKGWFPSTEDVCIFSLSTTDTLELWTYYSNTDWQVPNPGAAVRNFRVYFDTTTNQVIGSASFSSSPSGARIWIDGFDQGVVTSNTVTNLCAGTHTYTLKLAGYQDATGTFTVTIGATTTVPTVTLIALPGSASFTSNPSGARIWIDGTDSGVVTPGTISNLSSGSHNYTLKLTGYNDATGTFSVTSGTTTTVPTVTLTPATGNLSISSTPTGARIYVDNIDKGVYTPNTITGLTAGSHTYKLTLTGYVDATGSFSITGGQTTNLPVTFSPSAYFTSVPSGASIYIDNVLQTGFTTPATITNVSAGGHTYRLVLTGYADVTGSFTATAGQTINVPVTFSASAYFTSTPSGARIYIDNIDLGVNTPNTITNVSAGTHSYKLTLTGYADATGSFIATSGTTTNIPVTFSASAYFTSTPIGARIYIDDIDQGINTPNIITGLSTGSHTYKLTLTGYADVTNSFTTTAGTTTNISVTFPGSLYISSIPTGASIYIDNVLQTGFTSPATITGISAGSHTYKLTLAGYADITDSFTITAGTTTTISTTFPASLNISSIPTGASIYIDNVLQTGTNTPTTITGLSTGSHTYKLTLAGYADVTDSFTATTGTTTTISVTFPGSLSIISTPPGARIFIDDIDQGVNSPYVITGLLSGIHNIKLTLTNYYDYTTTANIIAGQTTTINPNLVQISGSLDISSTPSGASIYIDNILQTGITTPIVVGNLSIGNHTFKLSHIDYDDVTGNFDIYSNQITILTAILPETPGIPYSYVVWDPTNRARLRVYKCKKINIEQTFLVDAATLSFDYETKTDAEPEIVRWQLIVGGLTVMSEIIPTVSYGRSTGTITKDVSAYIGSNATIKFFIESGPDCKLTNHENTYLWIDNVKVV